MARLKLTTNRDALLRRLELIIMLIHKETFFQATDDGVPGHLSYDDWLNSNEFTVAL